MNRETKFTIRKAVVSDIDALVRFNLAMAAETEGKILSLPRLEAGVRSVFDDPSKGFYVIAEEGGKLVGGLLVTPEWSDWRNASYWWIQSVYVAPPSRKRGVYKRLHRHVESAARSAGDVCGLRLYVDAANASAKSVYKKLGMSESRYEFFESAVPESPDPR